MGKRGEPSVIWKGGKTVWADDTKEPSGYSGVPAVFKELLINTKGRKVRQEYVRIMAILDYIEQNQVDFGPYDETFWQKEEEDTDE